MQSWQANPSRGGIVDRAGVTKATAIAVAATGPHGDTSRGTYTVPAAKRAAIPFISLTIRRVTAAAPLAEVYLRILLTPSGGAAAEVVRFNNPSNAVEGDTSVVVPFEMVLQPGDLIDIHSFDGSTGGTVAYEAGFALTEFDL